MKNFIMSLALASTVLALPTQAQAATPYVETTTNYNGTNAEYGAKAGLQLGNVTGEVGAENFLNGGSRTTYVASLGLQPKIFGPFSAYGQVGYLNRNGTSGFRLGGGGVVNLTTHLYAKGGYQRDDYGNGHSDAATFGLGLRF